MNAYIRMSDRIFAYHIILCEIFENKIIQFVSQLLCQSIAHATMTMMNMFHITTILHMHIHILCSSAFAICKRISYQFPLKFWFFTSNNNNTCEIFHEWTNEWMDEQSIWFDLMWNLHTHKRYPLRRTLWQWHSRRRDLFDFMMCNSYNTRGSGFKVSHGV